MLNYNTQQKQLVLPEYGRNIQRMVDFCLTVEDRDERNLCARAVIEAMGNLFPEMKQTEDSRHKLWDHLAIMSNFKLDIDYPFPVIEPDNLVSHPAPVPYTDTRIQLRHYGLYIEQMLNVAAGMPDGEERQTLIMLLANHMKKAMLAVNPDGVDDRRVFADIARYTHGAIRLDPEACHLHEFRQAPTPSTGKKKKKK